MFTRSPLPPNRTCGFPASGSPVSSFTSVRIGTLNYGLLPSRTTQCRESQRLAIFDDHLLPFTPFSRAANIRSVHTDGSAQGNLTRVSPPCLGHEPINDGFGSFGIASRIYLPGILCSAPVTTHQRYYDASDSRWGLFPIGSPSVLHTTFLPFHPQPPYGLRHRFNTLPLSVTDFLTIFR